jgi:CDGSH-type Zn-finger protein
LLQGFCDGSHAKPKCGCGKTKDAKGLCDGSHAK